MVESKAERQPIKPAIRGQPTEEELMRFSWWHDLSEDGQKLYKWLLCNMGDVDKLPADAEYMGFDLNVALDEIREWGLLDESDAKMVRLKGDATPREDSSEVNE